MSSSLDKTKITEIIAKAEKKGLIKSYSKFCETKDGEKNALSKDEIIYYTSNNKGATK